MKRSKVFSLLSSALLACTVVVLTTGCADKSNRRAVNDRESRYGGRYGYQGDYTSDAAIVEATETVTETVTETTTPPPTQPTPPQNVVTAATTQTPVKRNSVYGTKVPGKPGYVYGPFDPRLIDVRGQAPGTEVRCPYTDKIFLVP